MTQVRPSRVVFDKGPSGNGAEFSQPTDIIRADTADEVDAAFTAMQRAKADGKWLAGYVSYEFGYLTSHKLEKLMPENRETPLIHFGVFDAPQPQRAENTETQAELDALQPQWSAQQYGTAFDVVHDYIGAGDIYQVNLTFPIATRSSASSNALYASLTHRQNVPHGALVDLEGVALLSRSPELFFSLSAKGELKTKPMKGTAPRGNTPDEDDALRDGLKASEKNRAENLMIVDLLRNDMSRVSEIGSVKVPELFAVERFATLHQMTSTITSKVVDGTNIKDLFMALFPCGSITGAPKVRAMEIISEVETQARGAYCGSIGWIAPSGAMEFSVAIRTLMYRQDGTVQLNVGGGVVYDSTAQDEYDEALLKAQFAKLS